MSDIQATIVEAFERRADITPRSVETHVKEATLRGVMSARRSKASTMVACMSLIILFLRGVK